VPSRGWPSKWWWIARVCGSEARAATARGDGAERSSAGRPGVDPADHAGGRCWRGCSRIANYLAKLARISSVRVAYDEGFANYGVVHGRLDCGTRSRMPESARRLWWGAGSGPASLSGGTDGRWVSRGVWRGGKNRLVIMVDGAENCTNLPQPERLSNDARGNSALCGGRGVRADAGIRAVSRMLRGGDLIEVVPGCHCS